MRVRCGTPEPGERATGAGGSALGKAHQDVKRDKPLAEARAIAQSQFDNDIQAELGAQAAVETAKAAVEQAQLNVGSRKSHHWLMASRALRRHRSAI